MLKKHYIIILTLLYLVAFSHVVYGENIETLIQKGKQEYTNKNYEQALTFFQQVVQQLQTLISHSIEKYFPATPSGWAAEKIESQSWTGATNTETHSMINLTRKYKRSSDGVTCNITITNWPTMIQSIKASVQIYDNPQMKTMLTSQGVDFMSQEKDGWKIFSMLNNKDNTIQAHAFSDKMLMTIQLKKPDKNLIQQFIEDIDFKGLNSL